VVHALPQVVQFAALVIVSTHEPLHSVGALAGQPETHAEPPSAPGEQSGVPPEQVVPHAPQLGLADSAAAHPVPASWQSA
jgi:hypothetical protein